MRVRLTDIKRTKTKREKKPQTPRFVDTDILTIGRGTDCDVHLSGLDVKFHHAAFVARQGRVFLEKQDVDAVVIERRDAAGRVESHDVTSGKEASVGDILRIGRYEITVSAPSEGEALALEIEEVEKPASDREGVEKRYQRGVERGLLRRRPLSWALAILLLAAFLIAPLLISKEAGNGEAPAGKAPDAKAGALPGGAVPVARSSGGDRFARLLDETWNVGPIASKHGAVACASCHAKAWERVGDESCAALGCHADVGGHVDGLGADAWRRVVTDQDAGPMARCVHCHTEHRGENVLIKTGDRYCTSCHAGLIEEKVAHPSFLDVEAFSRHPELRPSLIEVETISADASGTPAPVTVKQICAAGSSSGGAQAAKPKPAGVAGGAASASAGCVPARRRVPIGSPELIDLGVGLIFPHDVHLVENLRGFTKAEYTQLECSSCHAFASGGEVMTKVSYAKNCQTCHWHSLRFSEAAGTLEAPHPAQIEEVRRAIREFFLAQELRDLPASQIGGQPLFQRPGVAHDADRRAALADARKRAEAKADAEATSLIEGQCRSCHVLDGEGETLRVRPVFLIPLAAADRWLPFAEFSHEAHQDLKYPAPWDAKLECESCHAARSPATGHRAELVLLPKIEECQKCHVGEVPEPNMVVSNCLKCHEFHHKRYGPMSAEERTAAALRLFPASRDRAS